MKYSVHKISCFVGKYFQINPPCTYSRPKLNRKLRKINAKKIMNYNDFNEILKPSSKSNSLHFHEPRIELKIYELKITRIHK